MIIQSFITKNKTLHPSEIEPTWFTLRIRDTSLLSPLSLTRLVALPSHVTPCPISLFNMGKQGGCHSQFVFYSSRLKDLSVVQPLKRYITPSISHLRAGLSGLSALSAPSPQASALRLLLSTWLMCVCVCVCLCACVHVCVCVCV